MDVKYILVLLTLVSFFITPVSASIASEVNPSYDDQSQMVHIEITLSGDEQGAKASEYPRDFIILIDDSMSMREKYADKARIEWAKEATAAFLQSLYSYESRVGVMTFSDETKEISPLTYNFESIKTSLDQISPSGFSSGYGSGISAAVNALNLRDRDSIPYILIVTDGGDYGDASTVEAAVEEATKQGIIIYSIGIGQRDTLDEVLLRNSISEPTGGSYRYATLDDLAQTMTSVIDTNTFLSAANVQISIVQSDEAIIDSQSIPSRPLVTSGVVIASKDPFTYICPTLSNGEEIVLAFDTFTALKGQELTAGMLDVTYTNENGEAIVKRFPVTIAIDGAPLPWGFIIITAILIFALIGVIGIRRRDIENLQADIERLGENESKISKMKKGIGDVIERVGTLSLKVKNLNLNDEDDLMQWKVSSKRELVDSLSEIVNSLEEIKKMN